MPQETFKMQTEVVNEVAKAAPPLAIIGTSTVAGLSLNNFIGVATLVYIVLQVAYLVWKWRRDIKKDRSNENLT